MSALRQFIDLLLQVPPTDGAGRIEGLCLPQALQPLGIVGHVRGEELEGHVAIELGIAGAVNGAHPPLTQHAGDDETRDPPADHGSIILHRARSPGVFVSLLEEGPARANGRRDPYRDGRKADRAVQETVESRESRRRIPEGDGDGDGKEGHPGDRAHAEQQYIKETRSDARNALEREQDESCGARHPVHQTYDESPEG